MINRAIAVVAMVLLFSACSPPEEIQDPRVEEALAEIRALQFQVTCETDERPDGEPYWTVYSGSDGSESLELAQSSIIPNRLYLTTDWPEDFRPTDMGDVRCRTAIIANTAAEILESHGLDWDLIEVQAVQTAGMPDDQVRVWGRQEKRPEGSEFLSGR